MRVLVTGSAGVLGACLVERLRARGDRVRHLDLVAPDGVEVHGEEVVLGDVSDGRVVGEAARGVEVVYHLAAAQRMKPQFSGWSEEEVFERNLGGVRQVLRAAAEARVAKVVFVSSSGVYGVPRTVPVSEDHPTQPLGAYGHSKLLAEGLCREAVEGGLDVTWLRPMSLFGPRMTGVFVMLFEWVRTGRPVYTLGRGANRVQMSSAWDVADACILAAEQPGTAGRVFNLGCAPETVPTVLELVQALVAHAGTGSPIYRIPAAPLRGAARLLHRVGLSPIVPEHYILADREFILDIRAARQGLGWAPRHDSRQMVIDAYEAYLDLGPEQRAPLHPMVRLLNWVTPGWRRRRQAA